MYDALAATPRDAVVTLWFVTTAHPEDVVAMSPKADRGFGRKYLAQLNPAWPITVIGQFSLNRSAVASENEFYIAGLPGLAVVQTVIEDASLLSQLDPKLLRSLPAADVFAFAVNEETGLGGFAHFAGGRLRRSFSARRSRVYEDLGLPEPFEAPFWSGEYAGGINLPFDPIELVREAQRAWLGFDIDTCNDINVVAYAIDGRPEPKLDQRRHSSPSVAEIAQVATGRLGLGSRHDYDDYEEIDEEEPNGAEFAEWFTATGKALKRIRRDVSSTAGGMVEKIKFRMRHTDRPAQPKAEPETEPQAQDDAPKPDAGVQEEPKAPGSRDLYED